MWVIRWDVQGTNDKHAGHCQFPLPLHLKLDELKERNAKHPKVHNDRHSCNGPSERVYSYAMSLM
jgi:hypothetical protein